MYSFILFEKIFDFIFFVFPERMSSSTIKRKEAKPGGDLDELSPFKRLRIYAPEKDKKEAERSKKYNNQTEKALRKQGMNMYLHSHFKQLTTWYLVVISIL